jgi:hypothetical protein
MDLKLSAKTRKSSNLKTRLTAAGLGDLLQVGCPLGILG